ncbi:hypothetical protein [Herbiconiux sp. VKM Ac-2851]|uniref:hypothetical protein n=1 Tax=Herbiconiux sp. VKM Ac-2851 TaxID=2739025 RepID=UPI0015646998|nr:hypothetical protein [Herbiconiux sp. VKM Ac-2851]NQX36544.1 hypothetical protein [Herbiconiux sp. VKM Ac-2851]
MKIKKLVALGAALGVAVSGLALGAGAANAEPVSASYVMVGSDTLQDVTNALSNSTSASGATVRVTAGGKTIASFDAFGTAAIQTKPNGPYFGRPAGSGAGVNALRASINGTNYSGNTAVPARAVTGQIDIARSSSGPGANASNSGKLAYVPFARDAVSYAYKGDSAVLGSLTAADLKAIYESNTPVVRDGVTITALIPQSGSGTRNFFLGQIGVTNLGSAVDQKDGKTPENDATVLGANQIIPFSAGSWVAQANGVTGVSTIGTTGVQLGSLNGIAPFTGTGSALVPNADFYSSSFGRDTYLVVERARITSGDPKFDAGLTNLVDRTKSGSLTNFGALASTPGAVKKKFGFLTPASTTVIFAYDTI